MIKIITKEDYNKFVENDNLNIIKVSAPWCNPCKVLGATIEKMEPIEGVEFAEVDVDEAEEELVNEFNVRNVPVLIFIKNGLQIDRNVGLITADSLLNKIKENKEK